MYLRYDDNSNGDRTDGLITSTFYYLMVAWILRGGFVSILMR